LTEQNVLVWCVVFGTEVDGRSRSKVGSAENKGLAAGSWQRTDRPLGEALGKLLPLF
jgi:hypothetical protein